MPLSSRLGACLWCKELAQFSTACTGFSLTIIWPDTQTHNTLIEIYTHKGQRITVEPLCQWDRKFIEKCPHFRGVLRERFHNSPFEGDSLLLKELCTSGPTEPDNRRETKHWVQIPFQPLLGLGVWIRDGIYTCMYIHRTTIILANGSWVSAND